MFLNPYPKSSFSILRIFIPERINNLLTRHNIVSGYFDNAISFGLDSSHIY
jgi:hypothetical protein